MERTTSGASRLLQIANVLDVASDFFLRESRREFLVTIGSKGTGLIQAFISSWDGTYLSKAFLQISDAKMRRSIVVLVKQIA